MTHHDLKTAPTYFEAVWDGSKTFEVRLDDRGYQCGDTVALREWDRTAGCMCPEKSSGFHTAGSCTKYTGREITATIGYVLASTPHRGSVRGFNGNGYVVFSLVDTQRSRRLQPDTIEVIPTPASVFGGAS